MPGTRLLLGDCVEVLKTLPENSVDAVVCDPPYGLEFMGKEWDSCGLNEKTNTRNVDTAERANRGYKAGRDGASRYQAPGFDLTAEASRRQQAWHLAWAREVFRVLKPGGHLIAFGGTRTYHRLACAVEDAGFEVRDQIQWVYGSGFPKSKNLDGEWEGWGTALKPANEPAVLARKPLEGTVAENVLKWGTGALNIDGCRIPTTDKLAAGGSLGVNAGDTRTGKALGMFQEGTPNTFEQHSGGRWPANVMLDEEAAAMLDAQSGLKQSQGGKVSRFFYCPKVSKKERDGSTHPTMKPIALMEYLIKLVTPPNGTVLDPFMGSGSTGIAAVRLGRPFIGIEREDEYFQIAARRIQKAEATPSPEAEYEEPEAPAPKPEAESPLPGFEKVDVEAPEAAPEPVKDAPMKAVPESDARQLKMF